MRLIRLLFAIACLVAGAVVGALNRDLVSIDFAFIRVGTTLGVALISSLLIGVLLGGLAITASVVLPLRGRLSRMQKQQASRQQAPGQRAEPVLAKDDTDHTGGTNG